MEKNKCGCGCGHEHSTQEEKKCGCGHEHHKHEEKKCGCGHEHHNHDDNCGCGHDHSHKNIVNHDGTVTDNQAVFLKQLKQFNYLPVAQCVIKSSTEHSFSVVAISPMFIRNPSDSLELVKEAGEFLLKLENQGLIEIDFDIPLNGYEYLEYKNSEVYKYFSETINDAPKDRGFLGDTPTLELGSMVITKAGEDAISG